MAKVNTSLTHKLLPHLAASWNSQSICKTDTADLQRPEGCNFFGFLMSCWIQKACSFCVPGTKTLFLLNTTTAEGLLKCTLVACYFRTRIPSEILLCLFCLWIPKAATIPLLSTVTFLRYIFLFWSFPMDSRCFSNSLQIFIDIQKWLGSSNVDPLVAEIPLLWKTKGWIFLPS